MRKAAASLHLTQPNVVSSRADQLLAGFDGSNRGAWRSRVAWSESVVHEMCGAMKFGKFTIASHMSELTEEILSYHRDEDYKIVKIRDDLISAMRYAFMSRRLGKRLDECDSYGRAPGTGEFPMMSRDRGRGPQIAKGVDFDVFTGGDL